MCGHSPGQGGCGPACAGSQSLHSGGRLAPDILDVFVCHKHFTFFKRAAGRRKGNMERVKLIAAPGIQIENSEMSAYNMGGIYPKSGGHWRLNFANIFRFPAKF